MLKVENAILVWMVAYSIVNLPSTSRSRAAVARRAHNPKVGGSNPPFATKRFSLLKPLLIRGFYILKIIFDVECAEFCSESLHLNPFRFDCAYPAPLLKQTRQFDLDFCLFFVCL